MRKSCAAAGIFLSFSASAFARISVPELIGIGEISGTATDDSGMTDTLADGTPHNRMGGFGSAIAWTGKGDSYLLLADRGPADGATSYVDRFYTATISFKDERMAFALTKTTLLRDEAGRLLNGDMRNIPAGSDPGTRFDPEGIRLTGSSLLIAEEYGPVAAEFGMDGHLKRRLTTPRNFTVNVAAADPEGELPPANLKGRAPNRGIEGLAVSNDGRTAWIILQGALIQDGVRDDDKWVGTNVRIAEIDIATGQPGRQFLYPLEHKKNSVNEILAINDHEFLVIERDSKKGSNAKYKRIYKIDIAGATDIRKVAKLPPFDIPRGVEPVKKKLVIDFLAPDTGIPAGKVAEKLEGMTFGPPLKDGRKLLLITSDNDFVADIPTYIYAFAIDKF